LVKDTHKENDPVQTLEKEPKFWVYLVEIHHEWNDQL
jgi:hypothetical protein